MNIYESARRSAAELAYPKQSIQIFESLNGRVLDVFQEIEAWDGWRLMHDPATPRETILAVIREIYRSVCWYDPQSDRRIQNLRI